MVCSPLASYLGNFSSVPLLEPPLGLFVGVVLLPRVVVREVGVSRRPLGGRRRRRSRRRRRCCGRRRCGRRSGCGGGRCCGG